MDYGKLRIKFFMSNEIKKDDILWGLLEMQLSVEVSNVIVPTDVYTREMLEMVIRELQGYNLVITQNFYAVVAKACNETGITYISWVYDAPQTALYRSEAKYDTNAIFCFDRMQIKRLQAIGVKNLHHCPLASNFMKTSLMEWTREKQERFQEDVSFVGQLYNRIDYEGLLVRLPHELRQKITAYLERNVCHWENNEEIFGLFTPEDMAALSLIMDTDNLEQYAIDHRFMLENSLCARYLAKEERITTMNAMGNRFSTSFYTYDAEKETRLHQNIVRSRISEEEMYAVFHFSRINLNLSMRSIESGVPQRVFDIMAVGGFVLSNYQPEAEELFVPGKEIVLAHSLEEMVDLTDYYLRHETQRSQIARAGYERVKKDYSYTKLLGDIFQTVFRKAPSFL
ncbi:MAG: glycosyltransferase [Lachnospiraceae bacterium]